jgi:adenosine deaminase
MDAMLDREIAIEGNLTSNVQTMTTADYASHPLRAFLEHGLCVTLNTDDPGISAIDLVYEYDVAAPAAGFSREQIRVLQANALRAAFLSEDEKAALLLTKQN